MRKGLVLPGAPPPLEELLEPGAHNHEASALVSIAISLKRIADAIHVSDSYDNPISRAIANGIGNGAQDWIGHMVRNQR